MIPIRDVIPTRTMPVATMALATENLALLLYVSLGTATAALLVYLAINAGCLWIFGPTVEDRMGHGRFLVFYAICGAAAALAGPAGFTALDARIAVFCGATAGVMGAYTVLYPSSRLVTLVPLIKPVPVVEVPAVYFGGLWLSVQLATGTLPAFLVGLATGMCAVLVFRRPERLRVEWWDLSARTR